MAGLCWAIRAGYVRRGRPVFKQVLDYHCLLVDVMDIFQVAAKGTHFHPFPALITLHVAGVPFGSCDCPALHPAV